ncbi:MAG TPA: hypothetical protein VIQ00_07205 [Chitinophagaceae bacterium]
MVLVSATGYTSQQVAHHINRGRIDELNFQLALMEEVPASL